jgi:hypothetical protein
MISWSLIFHLNSEARRRFQATEKQINKDPVAANNNNNNNSNYNNNNNNYNT